MSVLHVVDSSPWVAIDKGEPHDIFQVIFSSHGVQAGSFEFRSDLREQPGDRLFLNTDRQDFFFTGLEGVAENAAALTDFIKQMAAGREIICLGAGPGGFAAILFGAALQAGCVLAINPIVDLDDPSSPGHKFEGAAKVAAGYRDLLPIMERSADTQFMMLAPEWDIFHMRQLARAAQLNNVAASGLLNVDASVPKALKEDGRFNRLYARLLRGGTRTLSLPGMGPILRFPGLAEKLYAAKSAAGSNDWATAIPLFKEVADVIPDCEAALEQLGVHAMTQRDFAVAIDYFTRCAEINANRQYYRERLSKALRSSGSDDKALRELAGIASTAAQEKMSHKARGMALMAQGKFDDAVTALEEAVADAPDDLSVLQAYSEALRKAGRFSDALREQKRLLKLDSSNPFILHNMGVILLKSGDARKAIPYLEDAFHAQSDNAGFAHQLAVALFANQRYEESRKLIDVAVSLKPDNAGFQIARCEIALAANDAAAAEEAARAAVSLRDTHAYSRYLLGMAQLANGDRVDDAIRELRLAVTIDAKNPKYSLLLAEQLERKGELIEARALRAS